MNSIKKTISMLLTAFMVLNIFGITAYAEDVEASDDSVLTQDPYYYSEENVNDRKRMVASILGPVVPPIEESTKTLSIIGYKQENNYYCGPASVKIVLQYLNGTSLTQSQYAANMGTTTSGTVVYRITQELNRVLGANTYTHILSSDLPLSEGYKYSIDQNYPVILHADISHLPGFSGSSTGGHYVVGFKYNYHYNSSNNYVQELAYWDPYDNGRGTYGAHTLTVSEMNAAINAKYGYYIMRKK